MCSSDLAMARRAASRAGTSGSSASSEALIASSAASSGLEVCVWRPALQSAQTAAARPSDAAVPSMDVLLLGGRPIGEPVVSYGPFVMNTREEIMDAIRDYQAGRMGVVPAIRLSSEMGEPRG